MTHSEKLALGFMFGIALGALLLWLAVLLARPEDTQAFEDRLARELGYDPDACAHGDHPWYVNWGFCANPFCEALMPGLVRRNGQPTCTECDAVTTREAHREGCSVGWANFQPIKEHA